MLHAYNIQALPHRSQTSLSRVEAPAHNSWSVRKPQRPNRRRLGLAPFSALKRKKARTPCAASRGGVGEHRVGRLPDAKDRGRLAAQPAPVCVAELVAVKVGRGVRGVGVNQSDSDHVSAVVIAGPGMDALDERSDLTATSWSGRVSRAAGCAGRRAAPGTGRRRLCPRG